MNKILSIKDSKENTVSVGSYIKILHLDPNDFQFLDEEGLINVMSMVGEVFKVYEIDEYKQAWVEKPSINTEDTYESNSVGLSGSEIELVDEN